MTESSNESVTRETVNKVTTIVGLYATLISGLTNSDLPIGEKIAGVLCAGDLVKQATTMVLCQLCSEHKSSAAWVLGEKDIKRSAAKFAERMVK